MEIKSWTSFVKTKTAFTLVNPSPQLDPKIDKSEVLTVSSFSGNRRNTLPTVSPKNHIDSTFRQHRFKKKFSDLSHLTGKVTVNHLVSLKAQK